MLEFSGEWNFLVSVISSIHVVREVPFNPFRQRVQTASRNLITELNYDSSVKATPGYFTGTQQGAPLQKTPANGPKRLS